MRGGKNRWLLDPGGCMQTRTPTHRPPKNADGLPAGATQRWRRLTSVNSQ